MNELVAATKKLGVLAKAVKKKNTDNAVNFVLTNSATQGIVSQQDYFDKDIANQNNLEGYYVVEVNDFVYNPRISVHAPVGPIKRNKLQQGVMSPLYSIFRFNHTDLDFFELYFETTFWHKYLGNVANFGARHDRMNITVEDFYKMPIPLPSDEERQLITNYLKSISVKLKRANEELEQAQAFKKGLLQKMFV
jgi:type I restriction enzyme S subunit